jgi:putative heme-binding domain-containing protein
MMFFSFPARVLRWTKALTVAAICCSAVVGSAVCRAQGSKDAAASSQLFARNNLIAWCIVPFDSKKRGPEERAAMLQKLGFKHFAYDWRAEHIPSFDAEVEALKKHGVALDAFWVAPGELNRESRIILDLLRRHGIKAQLWVLLDLGADKVTGAEQERRVQVATAKIAPLSREAAKIGCSLALYNHGGWFGEPENQIAIIQELKAQGIANVGIVYNLHHGHDHIERFPALLQAMKPYLMALNLNGMDDGGDKVGRKILPLGQGERDLELLKTIRDSGYRGPIGILGHTQDDAEARLRDNLDGLDWLLPQLDGKTPGPRPTPRTPVPPRPEKNTARDTAEGRELATLVDEARKEGDPRRGAEVFLDPRFSCSSCHKIGAEGGTVGPELTTAGVCLGPEEIAESILWPKRKVKEGFEAIAVSTDDGKVVQGYLQRESPEEIVVREATSGNVLRLPRKSVEETRLLGTLMPEGLAASMTPRQRRNLVRFLLDLGRPGSSASALVATHPHAPASFPFDRRPLHPDQWPHWQEHVNRDRIYDFYAKEAAYFAGRSPVPALLPPYPGMDGGTQGHWGNQNEESWVDDRWNRTELGTVMCGVFRGDGLTVPKAVCIRLGDRGEISACFNPETLCYEAVWRDGFVRFSPTRHGFLDGLIMNGTPLPRPEGTRPSQPFAYHGFYRSGRRVVFAYRIGDEEFLDSAWSEGGHFTRTVVPRGDRSLGDLTRGGPAQWPQVMTTRGQLGQGRPYAIDTIEPPFDNPWRAMLFFGDHDFLPDGSAMLCTMQGDVWHVEGIDDSLHAVRWRRFASGLHQALGLVVADGRVCVLGRDQITRLHDLDGDGEADFYECVSNRYETSPAGHDFISGLQRDTAGNFYTASGKHGLLCIPPDGTRVDVVATGFRNPDGLGLTSTGVLTVPNSEGEWVPASMVCEVRPGGHYGYRGPRGGRSPDLSLVYLPRGLDNSSGAQVEVTGDRWGPLKGQLIHFSFGAGTHFLLLREQVDGQPQGAIVPLPGDFLSGVHRGRFNPADGQLYASGMAGWGTYTSRDGCFQRVRYTGDPVQLPVACHAHENGVLLTFSGPLERAVAEKAGNQFAQAWNYRYSSGYGSPELSSRHPGMPGHDPLAIRSAHVMADGRSLFLEIPDLQPVNQLHLHVQVDSGPPLDVFATVHKLAAPFTGFAGYRPVAKTIAAHPILADMAALNVRKVPNRWNDPIPRAREIRISAGKNLTFSVSSFTVRAGEPIKITFSNPDVVPHNWALARPGTLAKVGDLANRIIAEPDAVTRHYIPRTDDILVYADIVDPGRDFIVFFYAPTQKGRYPYLCTFPGHWMVMNGVMTVE